MSKMKRAVAIALAAAMTMGSTLTVFADDTGAGGTSGKGENEGHVEKELINVVLPTVPEGDGSPFEYIADPERLIQSTAGARYEDYTFPEKDGDTGIYFLVGDKTYANTSSTLQVINKSSCDVSITVTATARQASDNDLALATSSTTSAATPLYLNMKVGQEDAVVSDTGATVNKVIAGDPDNFEIQYTGSAYEYVTKAEAAYWKAINFSLNGAVDEEAVVTAETTVPTIDVTWNFAKATGTYTTATDVEEYEETAEPAILSVSDYIKSDRQNIVVKFSLGKGTDVAVDADGAQLYLTDAKTVIGTAKYTLDMASRTMTIGTEIGLLNNAAAGDVPMYIVLTKGGSPVKELSGKIVVKDDYDDEPEIISIPDYNKANPQNLVIKFSLGRGTGAVDADGALLYLSADKTSIGAAKYTVDMSSGTLTIDTTVGLLNNATADVPVYIALTKNGSPVKELSGIIKIK